MSAALGLLGVVAWIVGVIGLAAAVTLLVVRLSPGDGERKKAEQTETG